MGVYLYVCVCLKAPMWNSLPGTLHFLSILILSKVHLYPCLAPLPFGLVVSGMYSFSMSESCKNEQKITVTSGLVKTQMAGPHPKVSASVDLGRGPRICISNKFPDEVKSLDLREVHKLSNFSTFKRNFYIAEQFGFC